MMICQFGWFAHKQRAVRLKLTYLMFTTTEGTKEKVEKISESTKSYLGGRQDYVQVDWCGLIPLTCHEKVWVDFPLRPPKAAKSLAAFITNPPKNELGTSKLDLPGVVNLRLQRSARFRPACRSCKLGSLHTGLHCDF